MRQSNYLLFLSCCFLSLSIGCNLYLDVEPDDANSTLKSELAEFGLICTTDTETSTTECLISHCDAKNGCLECQDPKGRTVIDCDSDPGELYYGLMLGSGPPSLLASLEVDSVSSGVTAYWKYPSRQGCEVTDEIAHESMSNYNCANCTFPDGSQYETCRNIDTPISLDMFEEQPIDSVLPGQCITEFKQDGLLECSTCLDANLSATIACRTFAYFCHEPDDDDDDDNTKIYASCSHAYDDRRINFCVTPESCTD